MSLDSSKASSGPDEIPGSLLRNTTSEIAPSLCKLFNLSLSLGAVPADWKRASVSPVFKKDDPTLPLAANYRPISLLCIVSKVLEHFIFNHCFPYLTPLFYHLQHGFLRGYSTVTQLLKVYHEILGFMAAGYTSWPLKSIQQGAVLPISDQPSAVWRVRLRLTVVLKLPVEQI